MSLRRRIALAATLAVAAVAVTLGLVGYLATRSHLYSQVRGQLSDLATADRRAHHGGPPGGDGGQPGTRPPVAGDVPHPQIGGAPGYFQSVFPDGRVQARDGGTPLLPVNSHVLAIARSASGSFYMTASVRGTHVEVLTVGDPIDRNATEVALPLTSTDSVLRGLVLTYALLVGGGILVAGLIGTLIARTALAPIERFSEQTEQVTSALQTPRRLEEGGAAELRRLAASFNETLDALERSVQAQRHLIADASHELRTPMAALRSNIQIFLEAERLPASERAELQESILAELDELTQLVSDVLELARGAAPGERLDTIELDAVVREAIARAQRRAPGLRFEAELDPTVIINAPDRVARAVTNVIDNARKWSPETGRVEVSLHERELIVRDHGPGFAEADLEHVFDRFYRADAARRMPGSGLGLAIVKQAAEAYGGSARAANAEGGGAVLRVIFGSASGGEAPRPRTPARPPSPQPA